MRINYIHAEPNNFGVSGTPLSDWIYNAPGSQLLDGGLGKDVFCISGQGENQYILDFQDGLDLIDLFSYGVTSFDQLDISYYEPGNKAIISVPGGPIIYVHEMDPAKMATIDASDFIFKGTPVYEYSKGFDSVNITQNEYAIHMGNGGSNWMNLKSLVRGAATATEGAMVKMDDGDQGNGSFTVMGVTQHFFDFRNIRGTNGQDTIIGDDQDNNLVGLGNADRLYGGDGDDRLFGNRGSDRLYGQDGDDVLNGGTGRDLLWGGEGADSFVFVAYDNRRDIVFDYEDGTDMLDISQWGASSVSDLNITQLSAGRLMVESSGGTLSFELRSTDGPLVVADLDDADFIFV